MRSRVLRLATTLVTTFALSCWVGGDSLLAQEAGDSSPEASAKFTREALLDAAATAQADGRLNRLDAYLRFMGKRFDFYFTIEEAPHKHYDYGVAERGGFPAILDAESLDDFAAKLDEEIDYARIVRSAVAPNVLHVIAEKLPREGYVLDRPVTAHFEGKLALLPSHLGRDSDGSLMGWSVGAPPSYLSGDGETSVEVSSLEQPIRDVLTAAVPGILPEPSDSLWAKDVTDLEAFYAPPLGPYDRLLWTSAVRGLDSSQVQVRYSGPEFHDEERMDLFRQEPSLGSYLAIMSRKLDFHYTIEDRPNAEGALPWIDYLRDFAVRTDIDNVDDLVAHLDESAKGVKVVRSEKFSKVVHLMPENLPTDDVMERRITVRRFVGDLAAVPGVVGRQVDGLIAAPTGGVYPPRIWMDYQARTTLDVENEKVRDVLTAAAPMEDNRRFLWESSVGQGRSERWVTFNGPRRSEYERLTYEQGLAGYLREMGNRLDCYFTFEDWGDENLNWRAQYYEHGRPEELDLEIDSVEDLAEYLDGVLNLAWDYDSSRNVRIARRLPRVHVVRSEKQPRVIHLIDAYPGKDNVLDRKVDVDFWGRLNDLPRELGKIDPRIGVSSFEHRVPHLRPRDEDYGDRLPYVKISLREVPIREALTEASRLDGHRRILWRATSSYHPEPWIKPLPPQTAVHYFGAWENVAEALEYDENAPPTPPAAKRAGDPFGVPVAPAADPFGAAKGGKE